MESVSLSVLVVSLILLIVLSAFFSATETAMMRLSRHRLHHLNNQGHKGARRVLKLLERPDRLIGIILLGNNFVNILASSITTIIALRTLGEAWVAAAAGLLTMVVLVFAEVTPKTAAALHPERIAFPASRLIPLLLSVCYPLVWIINSIANGLLRLLGMPLTAQQSEHLSSEELRIVVNEAGGLIPRSHQKMLLNILDLEKACVDDIMIPRNEITGIDLEGDIETIHAFLEHCPYTRLPIFRGDIDEVVGILHVRSLLRLIQQGTVSHETLVEAADEPYFIPQGTELNTQLINFQQRRQRIALVVDEYGDIEGLVTLEDILEEIVGEFTTDIATRVGGIRQVDDEAFLIDGGTSIRVINRTMGWRLPTDGPKTLSGLIVEYLETIPQPGTSLRIDGYTMEIRQVSNNLVKSVYIRPPSAAETGED